MKRIRAERLVASVRKRLQQHCTQTSPDPTLEDLVTEEQIPDIG